MSSVEPLEIPFEILDREISLQLTAVAPRELAGNGTHLALPSDPIWKTFFKNAMFRPFDPDERSSHGGK